jgi:hypothetical protein
MKKSLAHPQRRWRALPKDDLDAELSRRVQPNRWFSRGSIAESMRWVVLHRPVELASLIGTRTRLSGNASRQESGVSVRVEVNSIEAFFFESEI